MELDADGAVPVLGGDSLFMISDGRDGQCDRQIRSEVKKKAKAAQSVCTSKGCVNFRLMFHLRELSASGHFGLRSKKTMHSQLAEPLETFTLSRASRQSCTSKSANFWIFRATRAPGASAIW